VRVRLLLGTLAVCAGLAAPANAHEGNPNYRSEITAVEPSVPGLEADVVNFDDSLELRNETAETVVVLGYDGEPYLRMQPDGTVEVNQRSPSFYLNQDRLAESEVPASADEDAPPDWRLANDAGEYAWHDHRIHYMGTGIPGQVADEGTETKIFDYRIPILVGDERVQIEGTLTWVGQDEGFPLAALVALGAAAALAVLVVLLVRRRRRSRDRAAEPGEAW
jgi:hypothetical protein